MFQAPDGQTYEGSGMPADVEVPMDTALFERTEFLKDPTARLTGDAHSFGNSRT